MDGHFYCRIAGRGGFVPIGAVKNDFL